MTLRPVSPLLRALQARRSIQALMGASLLVLAGPALADTVTISKSTTAPVATATADNGNPGDIDVSTAGSINPTDAAAPALTLNSNNTIELDGAVSFADIDNTVGIKIDPGFTGSVGMTGTITLGPASTDTSVVHHDYANDKTGILLASGGTFTGNITLGSSVTIHGDDSVGVDLQGELAGNYSSTSTIFITGDNSIALRVAGAVDGDLGSGAINVVGIGSSGVVVSAHVTGAFVQTGTSTVTGYDYTVPSTATDSTNYNDTQKLQQSGPAISIGADIDKGILLDGPSPTEVAAVTAGTESATDETPTASISEFGSAPALLVSPSVSGGADGDVSIGAVGTGDDAYGIINRASITTNGVYDGITAEGILIEGAQIGASSYQTIVSGGFRNDLSIGASASMANATGLTIGNLATVPTILNGGSITGTVSDMSGTTVANAIHLLAGANVTTINNTGSILAQFNGNVGSATAIISESNSLTTITNTGYIAAQHAAIDDGDASNGTEVANGALTAVDLSSMSNGVTFTNDVPADFDSSTEPNDGVIVGDVKFGSGSDQFIVKGQKVVGNIFFGAGDDVLDADGGAVTGNLSFGDGADTLTVEGGSVVTGALSDSDGHLTVNVNQGTLTISSTGPVAITNATLGSQGILNFAIDTSGGKSAQIDAAGTVTFTPGAVIGTAISGSYVPSFSSTIVTAGNIQITGDPQSLLSTEGVPFVYNAQLTETSAGGIESLNLTLTRKTAQELNISPESAAAYDPLLNVLPLDATLNQQFLLAGTKPEFDANYIQFMPNYTDAMLAMAKQSSETMTSQIGQRLDDVLISNRGGGGWATENIYTMNRNGSPLERGYDAQGAVVSLGLDDHLTLNSVLGVLFGLDHGSYTEDGDHDSPLSVRRWTFGAYGGWRIGDLVLTGSALGALTTQDLSRHLIVGDQDRDTHAEWHGSKYGADISAAYFYPLGRLFFEPSAGVDYLHVSDDGYTESGGTDPASTDTTPGNAVAMQVDPRSGDSLSAVAQLRVGYDFFGKEVIVPYEAGQPYILRPELRLAYRQEFITDPVTTTARFVDDPTWFTLKSASPDAQQYEAGLGLTFETRFGTFGADANGVMSENTKALVGRLRASFRF